MSIHLAPASVETMWEPGFPHSPSGNELLLLFPSMGGVRGSLVEIQGFDYYPVELRQTPTIPHVSRSQWEALGVVHKQ